MIPGFGKTPAPPYAAVIFSAQRTKGVGGYTRWLATREALATAHPCDLGRDGARGPDGCGCAVIDDTNAAAIRNRKAHAKDALAQNIGKERWNGHDDVRVSTVERASSCPEGR
jgi:hypothetical protein